MDFGFCKLQKCTCAANNGEKAKEIFREYLATLEGKGKEKFSFRYIDEMRETIASLGYVITYGIHSRPGDKLILAKIEMKQD